MKVWGHCSRVCCCFPAVATYVHFCVVAILDMPSARHPAPRRNQPNVHESKLLDNPDGWHGAELSVVIAGALP